MCLCFESQDYAGGPPEFSLPTILEKIQVNKIYFIIIYSFIKNE